MKNNEFLETETYAEKLTNQQNKLKTQKEKTNYHLNLLANKYERLKNEYSRIRQENEKPLKLGLCQLPGFQVISMNELSKYGDLLNDQELYTYNSIRQNSGDLLINTNKTWMTYEQDMLSEIAKLDDILQKEDFDEEDDPYMEEVFRSIETKQGLFSDANKSILEHNPRAITSMFKAHGVQPGEFKIEKRFNLCYGDVKGVLEHYASNNLASQDDSGQDQDYYSSLVFLNEDLQKMKMKERSLTLQNIIEKDNIFVIHFYWK